MTLKLNKLSVLVVEDVAPVRQLIVSMLEVLGVGKVISAENGELGFKLFCLENPDIVITDWHMNLVDGIELTHRIRQDKSSPNKMAPVIMLTGFNSSARVAASRDIGVTEYIAKPFTADALIKRILHVIHNPRDFIMNDSYFGPDRRRREAANYDGPFRRISDEITMQAC